MGALKLFTVFLAFNIYFNDVQSASLDFTKLDNGNALLEMFSQITSEPKTAGIVTRSIPITTFTDDEIKDVVDILGKKFPETAQYINADMITSKISEVTPAAKVLIKYIFDGLRGVPRQLNEGYLKEAITQALSEVSGLAQSLKEEYLSFQSSPSDEQASRGFSPSFIPEGAIVELLKKLDKGNSAAEFVAKDLNGLQDYTRSVAKDVIYQFLGKNGGQTPSHQEEPENMTGSDDVDPLMALHTISPVPYGPGVHGGIQNPGARSDEIPIDILWGAGEGHSDESYGPGYQPDYDGSASQPESDDDVDDDDDDDDNPAYNQPDYDEPVGDAPPSDDSAYESSGEPEFDEPDQNVQNSNNGGETNHVISELANTILFQVAQMRKAYKNSPEIPSLYAEIVGLFLQCLIDKNSPECAEEKRHNIEILKNLQKPENGILGRHGANLRKRLKENSAGLNGPSNGLKFIGRSAQKNVEVGETISDVINELLEAAVAGVKKAPPSPFHSEKPPIKVPKAAGRISKKLDVDEKSASDAINELLKAVMGTAKKGPPSHFPLFGKSPIKVPKAAGRISKNLDLGKLRQTILSMFTDSKAPDSLGAARNYPIQINGIQLEEFIKSLAPTCQMISSVMENPGNARAAIPSLKTMYNQIQKFARSSFRSNNG